MSEFTEYKKRRVKQLEVLFDGILKGEKLGQLVRENQSVIDSCIPSDVISVVDQLVLRKIPIERLKTGVNKLLNLLHKTISSHPYYPPHKNSYLGCLVENNRLLDEKLKEIKPFIRELNKDSGNLIVRKKLLERFIEIEKYSSYYVIKENILFPLIEKYVPEFRCLSVMWSFQDDINRNLKAVIQQLQNDSTFDLKIVNRLAGDLFFNIYAIKFREERILYPTVQEVIPEEILNGLFKDSLEIGLPYYEPELSGIKEPEKTVSATDKIDLDTGRLSVEQIKLLFNHLPVDITFVDENNKVKYFSTPKKRIFPRTKSVIGRDVHNCHPPESVHVVEQIVESFRKGDKDVASFWINMKGERLLIQYFAVRDEKGNYKGVVEVSQEITEIQKLVGENRLLDWEG
jgi:PAS domain S-box-containing protein